MQMLICGICFDPVVQVNGFDTLRPAGLDKWVYPSHYRTSWGQTPMTSGNLNPETLSQSIPCYTGPAHSLVQKYIRDIDINGKL